jgi:hypothetical protein
MYPQKGQKSYPSTVHDILPQYRQLVKGSCFVPKHPQTAFAVPFVGRDFGTTRTGNSSASCLSSREAVDKGIPGLLSDLFNDEVVCNLAPENASLLEAAPADCGELLLEMFFGGGTLDFFDCLCIAV